MKQPFLLFQKYDNLDFSKLEKMDILLGEKKVLA